MHVFALLFLLAVSTVLAEDPQDGDFYDSIVDISDEPPESPKEYFDPESDPFWIENLKKQSEVVVREARSFAVRPASVNTWQCTPPSAGSVIEGENIIARMQRTKVSFTSFTKLSDSEAAAVAAYLRKYNPQALCPRTSSFRFAVPVKGQCACFVKCDKAPKVISVERCLNGATFQASGPEEFVLRLEGNDNKVFLESRRGDCMPVGKGVPVCGVAQAKQQENTVKQNPVAQPLHPRSGKKTKPFFPPDWPPYRGEDYAPDYYL